MAEERTKFIFNGTQSATRPNALVTDFVGIVFFRKMLLPELVMIRESREMNVHHI